MAGLEDLLNSSITQQIRSPEQQQAAIEAQVAANSPGVNRAAGAKQQQLMEALFGRGMGSGPVAPQGQEGLGVSTYLAQQLNPLMAEQNESLARIRQQATTDVRGAQDSAIGNALAAQQQRNQLAITAANNQGSADRQRQQQKATANQMRTQNIIGGLSGLGGGVGRVGAGMLTAKPGDAGSGRTVMNNLKGLFGPDQTPQTEGMPQLGPIPDTNISAPQPSYDYGQSSFPSSLSLGGMDSGSMFNPSDYGGSFGGNQMDWGGLSSLLNPSSFNWGDYY